MKRVFLNHETCISKPCNLPGTKPKNLLSLVCFKGFQVLHAVQPVDSISECEDPKNQSIHDSLVETFFGAIFAYVSINAFNVFHWFWWYKRLAPSALEFSQNDQSNGPFWTHESSVSWFSRWFSKFLFQGISISLMESKNHGWDFRMIFKSGTELLRNVLASYLAGCRVYMVPPGSPTRGNLHLPPMPKHDQLSRCVHGLPQFHFDWNSTLAWPKQNGLGSRPHVWLAMPQARSTLPHWQFQFRYLCTCSSHRRRCQHSCE